MISIQSTWALTLRYLRLFFHDTNVKISTFYWPFLDIVLWGFLGSWMQSTTGNDFTNYQAVTLLCIVLWQVTARSAQFVFRCFLEELWTRNLINIFSLPVSLPEWVASIILYSGIMTLVTLTFCMILMVVLYNISFWYLLSTMLLFAPPLFISGVWVGIICLQSLAYFGKRADEIGWVLSWFFAPFSGAFYPLDILPGWAQTVSSLLPMGYALDGMRKYLVLQENPVPYVLKAYAMGIIYTVAALIIFGYMFQRAKQKGLVRLFN
jgi:ABC-2 type transport system permease protein